jgi:hypothetical protein
LYSSCSINSRSLRTENSTCTTSARSKCSGGIDGRPVCEYSVLSLRDIACNAASVISRIGRNGWSAGIRASSVT